MIRSVAHVAVLVREYDEACAFYCEKLGFDRIEDTVLPNGKRWVRLRAAGGEGAELLLSRAADDSQRSRVGDQTGGRVLLFLYTDDFDGDYERLKSRGIVFTEGPWNASYGKAAVFKDLYGNRIDLIEPSHLTIL